MPPVAAELLQRRVLSVAAYAIEEAGSVALPSKGQRLRLYGSTVMPIPVALLPGESEAQYEKCLTDWLTAEGKPPLESYSDMPNQERSVRILFAKSRARAFESGRQRPTQQSTGQFGEFEVPRGLGQEMRRLYTKQFVDLDEYRRDVKDGKFARLAAMSKAEKIKLLGSPVVPIVCPLAVGETPAQYEDRFIDWLKRTHQRSLHQVRTNGLDKTLERYYRLQFASANASGHERFVPMATERKRGREVVFGDDTDDERPVKRADSTASRPLSVGNRVRDVPVSATMKIPAMPSTPGRCSLQIPSEAAPFHEVVAAYALCACKRCLLNGIQIMSTKLAGSSEGYDNVEGKNSDLPVEIADGIPKKKANIMARLGDEHTSPECREYEGIQVTAQLHTKPSCGINGEEHWSFFASEMQEGAEESYKHEPDLAFDATVQLESIDFLETLHHDHPASSELEDGQIFELAQHADWACGPDPMEAYLLAQYETSNQLIATKETALNAYMTRLNDTPPPSLEELTQLHDENQEIRSQLELETIKRNEALERLVVHMWRDEMAELEGILGEPTACDMAPVQRAVHLRCLVLANDITTRREEIADTKRQLDAAIRGNRSASGVDLMASIQPLGVSLATAEHELKELDGRRKREITTLLRFDKRLRDGVWLRLNGQRE